MFIFEDDVQRVIEETDIVAVIQNRVDLKKSGGSNWKGLCPFHGEKTPSFSVSQSKGLYHCFGCKASGNVITFLRELEHLDFQTAVEQLAEPLNIQLRYRGGGDNGTRERNKQLIALLDQAADYYHHQLLSSKEAGKARAYLRERGYDKEVIVKYQLGYAPRGRSQLADELLNNSKEVGKALATPELLEMANLAYLDRPSDNASSDKPTVRDRFSERVMFPIRNEAGSTVGFGGRLLPDGRGPKYLNSAQTPVYDKSRVLYGLNTAKRAIAPQKSVLICEGYTDVIGFSLVGLDNAVATCGTALTEQHIQLLSKFTKRFLLAFDSDSAGETATERFHQWERKYELEVAVVELQAGEDPGQLAISDASALRKAVEAARPFFRFRADRVLARHDLTQPITRGRAADELARVVAAYPADLITEADVEPLVKQLPMETMDFMVRVVKAREQLTAEEAKEQAREKQRTNQNEPTSGYNELRYAPPPDVPPPDTPPPEDHFEAYTDPVSPAESGRPPTAEIVVLELFRQEGQAIAPYLVPEMFQHPLTMAAYELLKRQHAEQTEDPKQTGKAPSQPDSQAVTKVEQFINDLDYPREMSDLDKLQSAGQAMAAAIERTSRDGSSPAQVRKSVKFSERVVSDLRGLENTEKIRELLAEGAAWFEQLRQDS